MKRLWSVLMLSILAVTLVLSGCSKPVAVDDAAQGEKIAQLANPDAFIRPDELKALIDGKDKDLVVIGVLDSKKALIPGNLAGSPIDGSYTVWRPDYSGKGSQESIAPEVGGFRKAKEEVETLLSKAGATSDSKIVVYAADAHHDAGRVFWQIKLLGHKDVKYLDGGLNAWVGAGYPTGEAKILVDEANKTDYKAANYSVVDMDVDINTLTEALENPSEWVVIDTRSKDEFDGKKTGSSKGAFGTGTIKGAVHIEWTDAVNKENTTLKSIEEIKQIYDNTIKGKKVIVYCQSGVRSAFTHMVLKNVLGAEAVYNYDGSWIEWSYVASEASNGKVDEALKAKVLERTENWSDNKGEIN